MSAALAAYADRLRGCWIGKSLGGAMGMPFEGCPGPRLQAEIAGLPDITPNDDLEMQMLALVAMERTGAWPAPDALAQLWVDHVGFAPDEYGIALRNLRQGLLPPASGAHDNWFRHGMGAVIRTEIWACLCPNDPRGAAVLAANDASIDHAEEGVWASAFFAAFQSAAFGGSELVDCLEPALAVIPANSQVHEVVAEVARWADPLKGSNDRAITHVHGRFGNPNFTDCLMNLAFILLALLRGGGDVRSSLQIALRCGEDADCTAASVGATLGIVRGAAPFAEWSGISEQLAVSANFAPLDPPDSMSALCERVVRLRTRLIGQPTARAWVEPTAPPAQPQQSWIIVPSAAPDPDGAALARTVASGELRAAATRHFDGVFLRLTEFGAAGPAQVDLVTEITVRDDFDGWLMIAADAGITAWLDEEIILNYHGRRSMIPAFHRTEGGGTVRVRLRSSQRHRLHVRLLSPQPPFGFCASLADGQIQPVVGEYFRL